MFLFVLSVFVPFLNRPPQKATFVARLAGETQVFAAQSCAANTSNLISGSFKQLTINQPLGRPLDLHMQMQSAQFEALNAAFGITCTQCQLITLTDGGLNLAVEQRQPFTLQATGAESFTFNDLVGDTPGISIRANAARTADQRDPMLQVNPSPSNRVVTLTAGLPPRTIRIPLDGSAPDIKTLRLPGDSSFAPDESLGIAFAGMGDDAGRDFHVKLCAKELHVQNAAQGVLIARTVSQSAGWGERLRLTFAPTATVSLDSRQVTLDASQCERGLWPPLPWDGVGSQQPCLTGALRNDVIELLPPWFDEWPDVAKTFWNGVVISTGISTLLSFLRWRGLWPKEKE
jgi:hypothetical protein